MIIVGLLLCPIVMGIVFKLRKYNLKKKMRKVLHAVLFIITFFYIVLIFILNTEPFQFEITRVSDYLLGFVIIFIFSPFLWIILYYYCQTLFQKIRIHKNAKIKSNQQYVYYRDDLDKIPPSIVMFTSMLDIDVQKCLAAVVLKLKLNGYIQEKNHKFLYTYKNMNQLLPSEKLVLKSLQDKNLNEKLYREMVEKEAIDYKYVKKNYQGKIIKIIKIMITLCIPVFLVVLSMSFSDYVFAHYKTYLYAGERYVSVQDGEIGDISFGMIDNIDDYYHGYVQEGNQKTVFYDKALVRADKFDNEIVRKTLLLQNLSAVFCVGSIIMIFVMAFMAVEQIIYFRKSYIRTTKGIELVNKAYALKNYLTEFSLMSERTEEEFILWEYYLIYAVVLGVNVQIPDKIMENYFSKR